MTLPRSRADEAPVAATASRDEGLDLGVGEGLGKVLAEEGDLGLFLGREVSRPPARNASTDSRRVFTSRRKDAAYSSSVRGRPCFFSTL